jgi:uncharacterized LabA/DUF88 family protein
MIGDPAGDSISSLTPPARGAVPYMNKDTPMSRLIAFIDGFNLYFGLRSKGWRRFYWLNLQKLAQNLLLPSQTLVETKYFTAKVKSPPDKRKRQTTYLEALGTLANFHIFYGHYLEDQIKCWNCGHTFTTYHEKMTDANIATELLTDAFQNRFDTALIISADGDLVGPVTKVKQLFPGKRIVVVFPPERHSIQLKKIADACLHVSRAVLAKSTFPERVKKADGFVLRRPKSWR